MCGVAGYSLSPNVRINSKRITREMLLAIEHRGRDATGFAFRDSTGAHQIHKADMAASYFVKRRLCVPKNQRTVIMHTRWATQGAPERNVNNHPVAAGTVVGVHNGHISNDDALFRAIERVVGYNVRVGEVDSEAAFAVLGYIDAPVTDSLEEISGGATLAWLDSADPDETLHLARLQSSPLVIAKTTDGSLFFASTEEAVFRGVHAAGLWIEQMLDVSEGQYFTVQSGLVTKVESFQPLRYYSSASSYTGMGSTYIANRGGSHWEAEEYEWQNGRLVRPNDLHSQVEANKRGNGRTPGEVGTVTSLSERLDAEEPEVGAFDSVDDSEALDEWFRKNAERITELEANLADRRADLDDELDAESRATVEAMRARVRWSRLPTLSTGLFDPEHVIDTPGETEYLDDTRHVTRSERIERFAANMSDKAKLDSAYLLKVWARPGDAVKCQIEDREYVGHIVLLPDTFPSGDYVLRLFALNTKRKLGHECILVSKPYHEFSIIGPGAKVQSLSDASAALEESNA